jgi:hypothetical protein
MAMQPLSYNIEHYNSLPSIELASTRFDSQSKHEQAFSDIGKIFRDFGVHDQLALTLLHKHFHMEAGQKLVGMGNVAMPLDCRADPSETSANIHGSSFRFVDGKVVPYEFSWDNAPPPHSDEPIQGFVNAFRRVLSTHDLIDVLGFATLTGDLDTIGMEFTQGNCNITLPFDPHPASGSVEALWHFNSDQNGPETISTSM